MTACDIQDCPNEAQTNWIWGTTDICVCKNHYNRLMKLVECMRADIAEIEKYGTTYEKLTAPVPEMCEDCEEQEEATIDGVPFGGYDRALCPDCRIKEGKRIERFVELYNHLPADEIPDMRLTINSWRYREIHLESIQGEIEQGDRDHDAAKYPSKEVVQ